MSIGEAIVFLDFDGVLHPGTVSREEHFICLPRFERVVREFDHARIVVSSSWRCFYTLAQMAEHFSADIRPRIVGATPIIEPHVPHTRHDEIQLYLTGLSRTHGSWIAIDDNPAEFPQGCRNLLLCNPSCGFDNEMAVKLRAWLIGAAGAR